jgi:carbonic anhydrase
MPEEVPPPMRQSRAFFLALVFVCGLVTPLAAQQSPLPFHPPFDTESLWTQLTNGNDLYQGNALRYTGLKDSRANTASSQKPPVTVLSCSDSRVPPELVFHRGIGELFVARLAGNVADTFGIASIEYAVAHDWTKVIVVLGHERCGAVIEALKPVEPGTPALRALVRRIRKSFPTGIKTGNKRDYVREAVIANAKASADYIVLKSKVIGDAVRDHKVGVVVAYYSMASGRVERIPWEIPSPETK